tara:strand:+ start:1540 stop:1818 length:279 start_codon:yes stop_codon:yes gene_type:complete
MTNILLKTKLIEMSETIVSAYIAGGTLTQIADLHEVSVGTVRSLLLANGVQLRPRGRPRKHRVNDKRMLAAKESAASPAVNETHGYEGQLDD